MNLVSRWVEVRADDVIRAIEPLFAGCD